MAPNDRQAADSDNRPGSIFSVSGPVVVAENMIGCAMYELVSCGYPCLDDVRYAL